MLRHRLITGPILILVLLLLVVADNWLDTVELSGFWSDLFRGKDHPPRGLILFALGLAVVPLAGLELDRIFVRQDIRTRPWLTATAPIFGLVLSYSVPMDLGAIDAIAVVATGLIVVFVAALLAFSRHHNVEGVVASAGAVIFAMIYLGLMLGFFLALRREHSAWWIVGIIAITKACDTGAYFTGHAIGRHKLIPWLSPGKTWEGLIGGIAASTIVGIVAALLSGLLPHPQDHVPLAIGALCGVAFGVVGQFGDLTMSLLKRSAGVKDSSTVLPGLGGIMDVLDSPLMVAPVAYWLVTTLT